MKIQIVDNLPNGAPWAIGTADELLINARDINDLEEAYDQALEEFYSVVEVE